MQPPPLWIQRFANQDWDEGAWGSSRPLAPFCLESRLPGAGEPSSGGRAVADIALSFWVLASPSASAAEVSSWWEMQMAPGEIEDTE